MEGVKGWGEHRDRVKCVPTCDGEVLAGMEPGAESVRRALGAEDGVRLDDPMLCLHLPGG